MRNLVAEGFSRDLGLGWSIWVNPIFSILSAQSNVTFNYVLVFGQKKKEVTS